MNTYFSRITADHWQAKNKLEEAAKDLAREMDRRLITETELEAFKNEFTERIQKLNEKFSRCKPLSFSIQNARSYQEGDDDVWIYCYGVFNMSLFLMKDRPITTDFCGDPPVRARVEYQIWVNQEKLKFYSKPGYIFLKVEELQDCLDAYRNLIDAAKKLLETMPKSKAHEHTM